MDKIARWCFKNKFIVIGFWIILLALSFILVGINGTKYSSNFSLPNTDSSKALNLLSNLSSGPSGETDTIVWKVGSGNAVDKSAQLVINPLLDKVLKIPQVGGVISPFSLEGRTQVSRDGKTAYARVSFTKQFDQLDKANIKSLISAANDARTSAVDVEIGGPAIVQAQQTPPSDSALVGIAAAAIILLIAFGSFYGMLLPLTVALVALGVGINSIGLLTHYLSIAQFAPTLGALIGLGVGIDYALFIVTRYRSGILDNLSPEDAATNALNTAGRAVLFAGGTVCIALLGLLTLRIDFLNGVGVSSSLVVLITVLSSITLLPAMLGVFKMKILSKKTRERLIHNGKVKKDVKKTIWDKNAEFVSHHPASVALVALILVGVLIIPFFSIRIGAADSSNDLKTSTTYKAYEMLANGFGPGFNGPLQLVASIENSHDAKAFVDIYKSLKNVDGIAFYQMIPQAPKSKVGVIIVVPTTSPESAETTHLINNLRKNVIPKYETNNSLHVYVGGITAIFTDFADVIASKLPIFLAFIIGFSFLILMIAFRSLVIPLTAAFMNLLAAGAAFGLVVTVFQWGWFSSILNTGGAGPIEAFLPVMMIAILFGLSMDYQVFLVSRMHEDWVHNKNNHDAVKHGQALTGRVITAAASIMILVFVSFVFGGQRIIAEFGIGLSSAVLIDAFVLRNFLVPALMHLFGNSNWWLPKWLDKILPNLAVEPQEKIK